MENNYAQAIAGMKLYDVLLVNTLVEGMNLVAKEGAGGEPARRRTGACPRAAAHTTRLAEGALSVAPTDVEGTAQALFQAITMPPAERRKRAALLFEAGLSPRQR